MNKALFSSFRMFVRSVVSDGMLLLMLVMPILMALLFKLAVPALVGQFHWTFLPSYYLLFDLFLFTIAPTFWTFASSMTILDEMDAGITPQLIVTPVGKFGYLFSRLGFPSLLSYPVICFIVYFAHLSSLSVSAILQLALLSMVSCLLPSLLVICIANNRVEGMAVNKLAGLLGFGSFVPFFITGWQQYLFAFLPSFWLAKFAQTDNYFFFALVLLLTVLISWGLFRKYERKIQ